MPLRPEIDGILDDWADVSREAAWSGLLVGNGASMAIWKRFGYRSLYETAATWAGDNRLTPEDQAVFGQLGTENFELVLSALRTCSRVCEALGKDSGHADDRYESVRDALIQAVRLVHIPWNDLPDDRLDQAHNYLAGIPSIYSTNYDLLLYWAIMHADGPTHKDYFWSQDQGFDVRDTDLAEGSRRVLYLHGALHLYQDDSGASRKLAHSGSMNILDRFFHPPGDWAVPLFVSEGAAEDKMRSIQTSDYLSFAFREFSLDKGPLVIFGQGLGESDKHIVDAMKRSAGRTIAISLRPGSPEDIVAAKGRFYSVLPGADLRFFDSTTHPLGAPSLVVPEGAS